MKQEQVVEEVVIDLILDDVMNDGTMFEGKQAHDEKGRFTPKAAGAAYASGAMAAGRAAGIEAKARGASRDEVRNAIGVAVRQHHADTQWHVSQRNPGSNASIQAQHSMRKFAKDKLRRALENVGTMKELSRGILSKPK